MGLTLATEVFLGFRVDKSDLFNVTGEEWLCEKCQAKRPSDDAKFCAKDGGAFAHHTVYETKDEANELAKLTDYEDAHGMWDNIGDGDDSKYGLWDVGPFNPDHSWGDNQYERNYIFGARVIYVADWREQSPRDIDLASLVKVGEVLRDAAKTLGVDREVRLYGALYAG